MKKSRTKSSEVKVVKIKTDSKFFGTLKTLIVAFIIALQIALLILAYLWVVDVFIGYLLLSFIVSMCMCLYVVSQDKNGYSKAVWTMFLILFFYFAWFFYIISHEKVFFYKSKKKYHKVFLEIKFQEVGKLTIKDKRVLQDVSYLKNSASFPHYNGVLGKYFASGAQFFDEVIEDIKNAKDFIFMEFFIVSNGVLLSRIVKILEEKVKAGVDVRIIYDDMGSHGTFSRKMKKYIKSAGIKLMPFNRLVPIFNVALNYRDHRKIIVIDGNIAYTGGVNLADEYINEKKMHGYWKDSGIKIMGRATDSFTTIFLRQWAFLTNRAEDENRFLNKFKIYQNESVFAPYADGLDYKYNIGKNLYAEVISKAQDKIYIATPYFVPEETIISLLKNKALQGVDVRILLPERPDKNYVYRLSISNARKLADFGAKIYVLRHSFVHSKVLLTDYSAVVGSINFDLRSFYQQFESAVYTIDKAVLNEIELDFEKTFSSCFINEFKKEKLMDKFILGILRIFSPLM